MRIVYDSLDNWIEVRQDGNVYHNTLPYGTYNFKNTIVFGREKRLPIITDIFEYPVMLIDNLISIGYIVLATTNECLSYNCINKHSLEKKGNYYVIPKKEFSYAKIKGINS